MQYWEDIAIGATQSFGHYAVTREEVLAFAEKYDPQRFHLDDAAAAKTHFGQLSASGWHTTAMTMRMIVDNMDGQEDQASLGAAGIEEIKWIRPVFPGDTLRVETEVLDKGPWPGRPTIGWMRALNTVFNQDDKPVMTMMPKVLIERRDPATG